MNKPVMQPYMVLVIGSISVIAFLMALMVKVTHDSYIIKGSDQKVLSVQSVRK